MEVKRMRSEVVAETYADAVERWGEFAQIVMAIEEMSELTKELTRYLRAKGSISKLAEEIADAEIMLEKLRFMFPGISAEADAWRERKLVRLRERLDSAECEPE